MAEPAQIDEMVDGKGGLWPQWRAVLGAFSALGEGGLVERSHRLDRAFEEEGVTSLLPKRELARESTHAAGAEEGTDPKRDTWRCDPVPLPLPAAEFAALEAGLAQRARLLEAVLQDLYGPATLLSSGLLPPALVYANPGFLRPCCQGPAGQRLQFYAADLVRGPDRTWRVLADRTAAPAGAGYARENRRVLARVVPEVFRPMQVRQLRPFFEVWQDALQRLSPNPANPSIALLTPGVGDAQWFEHMFLSRELSCGLVEGDDLTVRNGRVYLKTLRGLQPIDVLLRRVDGALVDPLELEVGSMKGVTGLLDAWRGGTVRIVNDPGTALAEAPALAAFLPQIAKQLLGEELLLGGVPTMWLGHPQARALLAQDPSRWLIRPALDGTAAGRRLAALPPAELALLLRQIEERPADYAATPWIPPSVAPCASPTGLVPRPFVMRLFLVYDGRDWQAMQGGLARVLETDGVIAGRLPRQGLSKDVWVLNEEGADIVGPNVLTAPPLAIRRTSGELPSRVADNLFWLGRYVERLENSARLVRSTLQRVGRGTPLPRDAAELQALSRCMVHVGLIDTDTGPLGGRILAEAVLASVRDGGLIARQFARVGRLTESARDRLTGDMYTTFTQSLREAHAAAQAAGRSLDDLSHAMIGILRFSAAVAGVAAENMVRGGGWLFLDLGRRIERAQAVSAEVASALDLPPNRIEPGLRLVLELCDSAITYRSRYLTVLQPAPVLDLVLADEGNPRALAFQLAAMRKRIEEVAGADDPFTQEAAWFQAQVLSMVHDVLAGQNQAAEAVLLPPRLRALEAAVADLSDRIGRRYFTLLPERHAVGVGEADELAGAA
jgi:uncharacterized circularly permuted ATP-grasp superfamily protein/uncharacterized alpha-E superfamily protein